MAKPPSPRYASPWRETPVNDAFFNGLLGRVLGLKYPQYADLLFDQGFHSSSQIKEWTNKNLSRLLPQEKQPITFSSLPFPTYIVSTDLIRSEAKVWSQMTTPNELVSDAVEASCAIPIFFQPVNRRYVDGGVLSNLPAYVFVKGEQITANSGKPRARIHIDGRRGRLRKLGNGILLKAPNKHRGRWKPAATARPST